MTPSAPQETDVAPWRRLQQQLAALGERRLVLVEGEPASALDWLRQQVPTLAMERGVWTGAADDSPDSRLTGLPPGQARQWLGRELDVVVWDGWHGNPPDGLAALAGTLKAGGLLFWLMPPLTQWATFEDPDYARTGLDGLDHHPFAARLSAVLAASPSVIRVNPAQGAHAVLPRLARPSQPFAIAETADQHRVVEAIVRTGQGRRRRPLVITADRGRGKSAALGIAAVRLLQQGRRHVVVTAPSAEAADTVFRHARLAAGEHVAELRSTGELRLADGGCLSYLPPDQLLARAPMAELVLVDEAAALPTERLTQILGGWPRVVFASTVHGYEGSGRGFAIRFRQVLDARTPQWRQVTLQTPIRWSDTDPLEPLISELFLLHADAPATVPTDGEVTIAPWAPARASEQERAEAFGLLVNAHYRTTPADLRQWLDDPDAVSWRLTVGGQLAGVLWASKEGGLEPTLAEQVMRGERRVRGHLLAQSLANHSGFPEAACCTWLRVVRVAVSEHCRSRGYGQQLVDTACAYAASKQYDGLGTSFGGNEPLIRFWQRSGLALARPGMTRETSTGEYPIQMLRGVSARGENLLHRIRQRLAEHWLALVPLYWRDTEPALIGLLTAELAAKQHLSAEDCRDLDSFASGHRGFELMVPVLRKVSLGQATSEVLGGHEDAQLWIRRVVQGWSWPELQSAGVCLGARDGEQRLRRMAGTVLAHARNL